MLKRISVASFSILAIALLAVIGIPAASAHTVLIGSDPAAGSTVSELPEQITLTFANDLLTLGSHTLNQVLVTDPMGQVVTSSQNQVKGAVLTNVLAPTMLMDGKYSVRFRVVAQDGHVVTGNFSFSVSQNLKNTSSTTPTPAIPTGTFHITATANGAGVMDGVGDSHHQATLDMYLNFSKGTACYIIHTNIPNILAAHVHAMNQTNLTISDEIFLPLDISSVNAKTPVCEQVPLVSLATLYDNLGHYMFMLHTKQFPDGAVGGQLVLTLNTASQTDSASQGITISDATVTSSVAGGDTAISIKIHNASKNGILVTEISSPQASSSMIFYDANMCQGNTTMSQLSNIAISAGSTQTLGYKYQGAMLSGVVKVLTIGEKIPLVIHWTDVKNINHIANFSAMVVKPPLGLHFAMPAMAGMSGMAGMSH